MQVIACLRSKQGTSASRYLRRTGKIPGIIYGSGKPQLIELEHKCLFFLLKQEKFHASILDLDVNGLQQQVLLRDVKYHPFKNQILHIDFQRVDQQRLLTTKVPIHFINQEYNSSIKSNNAIISHVMTELEIICLPSQLPQFIEVDLSKIDIGHSIHVKDVILPIGVTLASHIELENPTLASLSIPSIIEEDQNSSSSTKDINA